MKNVSFGLSSFLFLVPFFYCLTTSKHTKTFTYWKIALFTLFVSSFLCNYYSENNHFLLCDHVVIILLSVLYFLCFSKLNIAILICILFFIEIVFVKDVKTTLFIAFITLNLFAFTNFTKKELFIGISCFCIAIFCKLYRDTTCHITYPIYTTIWHACCVVLLLLASRSISR
jgi:hypothetical protein